MLKKVKIDDSGSSFMLPGSLVDKKEIDIENKKNSRQN
jgi:DNA-directed RNA polymerase subunit beta'